MSKVVIVVMILFVLAAAIFVGSGPAVRRYLSVRYEVESDQAMAGETRFLGIAVGGRFRRLSSELGEGSPGLTAMPMQAARAPESEQLFLDALDGRALIVQGHDGGGWIYAARVEYVFDPFTTMLIRHAYSR